MITDNKEYNGYRNWATWNVMLWFNNDELLYSYMLKAKSENELRAIFNSEFDVFVDFHDCPEERDNIDWAEIWEYVEEEQDQ